MSAACGVGLLATSGWLITRASERPAVLSLSVAIGAVQAFSLGKGIARYLERLGVHQLSLRLLGRLRLHLFDVAVPLVPGTLGGNGTGAVLSGFVSSTELVAEGYAKSTTAAVDVTASIALGTVLAALVQPVLGAVLLAGAAAVVALAALVGRWGRSVEQRAEVQRADLAHTVMAVARSAPELVAYGREDLVDDALERVRAQAAGLGARRAVAGGVARAVTALASGAALLAVVGAGLAARDSGHLAGVMLAVVTFTALAVLDQCTALPAVFAGANVACAARARLADLERTEPLVPEPPLLEPLPELLGRADRPASGVAAELAQAGTTTPAGTTVLDGVSLAVAAGDHVALVGPSGAGKTSAVHTLLHFVGCRQGEARLGGVDVSTMTREDIAIQAAWVPENVHIFAASVLDNLRLARPSASEADCRHALARVGLGTWAASLPEGMATRLGTGGRVMSAGEQQRLGLARALLAGSPLLLLDEPTAHLDPATGRKVLRELLGVAEDRSALVVSHDPAVSDYVDQMVSLDAGRVTGVTPGGRRARPPG
jgi:thiol reductant ABC exporter CydC subunit